MTKQAIIYTRFSPRPNAKECDSCEKQEERCRAYCERCGYSVRAVRSDKNISGGILNRPGLQLAIDLLDSQKILVVNSSDRLARDMLVYLTIEVEVEQTGATIEFADGSPPATTPEGRFYRKMLALVADYQRDLIRLRTKEGLARKRKNGERTTGKIPIGWKKDPNNPKRLVRCEQERKAIIIAWKLVRRHYSSREIAEILTSDHGLCRGKPWSARTVRKIIKREAYWADPIDGDPSLEPTHP